LRESVRSDADGAAFPFGGPAVVVSFVASAGYSMRRQGVAEEARTVALRPRLSLGVPLSMGGRTGNTARYRGRQERVRFV
jgi:hypothetical protein